MSGYIRANSAWRTLQKGFLYANGAWRSVQNGFLYANGAWRQFFSSGLVPVIAAQVTIAKSGSGTVTLTGTNRRWTNFSTGVYYFDSSTDNSNWTQMDTGAITNPAVGGTNTKTYILTQSDVAANTTNYYRFTVEVTSSTSTTSSSISTNVTVEGTRDITDLSATASLLYGSVIDLSWTASVYAGSQRVQYKLASSGIWSTFSTVSGSATSVSVTGLTGGGISYNFRILPYTGASATGYYGNYSNTATASTYAGNPYTFNFGNTLYIGTNGYISFDSGRTVTYLGFVGRVLSMLTADLVQDNLSVAASGSMQYIFWRGHRYGNSNTAEIRLEIQIPDAGGYAYIEYTFTTAVSPRNSSTISTDIGYYVDGVGPSGGYSNISSSILTTQQVLIYFGFGTSSGPGSGIFSSQGISWAGWIQLDTVTSGGLDDGYYALATVKGEKPSAPTSVTNSAITGTSATVSWSAPSSLGGSKILSYDWSTDQSNWTNTGLTTSASVTGLSSGTQYTVYIRARNHFFTGTSYGSTTFTTTAAVIPTVTDVTASSITSSGATISWTATNQSSYSLSGVGPSALTGTTVTSRAVGGLSSSTSYTAQVTVTSSTGNTASSSVNFTTLSAFVTPTVGVPSSFSFGRFNTGGLRQGVNWCWNHGSASGSVDTAFGDGSGITGYEWEIYTAPSGGAAINAGYKPYNPPPASLFLVSSPSGTTGAGSNSNSGPFNHKMGSSGDTPHTTSARYGRVRTVVRGSNGTDYYSNWTARI